MSALVVVSCGARKIWKTIPSAGPTQAKDVYTGPFFSKNKEYAETFSDRWVILSAKYGFINPDFVIPEDYNVSFKKKTTRPILISQVKEQVTEMGLDKFERVIVLGGSDYASIVRNVFGNLDVEVVAPLEGLQIGFAMSKVKKAIESNLPFD